MAVEFVTPEEVMDEMGLDQTLMDAAIPTIKGAITRATLMVQAFLDTALDLQNRYDLFFVDEFLAGSPAHNIYRLRLTNGFVKNVVVSIGKSPLGVFTPITPIDTDTYKGVVSLFGDLGNGESLCQHYVKVTYLSGFEDSTTLPPEIKQAILCNVPLLTLSTSSADADAGVKKKEKAPDLVQVAELMLRNFHRQLGAVVRPVYTKLQVI